ncbi:HTH DNA binding domain [Halomicrobium zhouii]|uniref:HTH DNA binding domain n=1 Tax=Halomicrobium zhouii TaxID=767519 RepID=A0A1I6L0G0_9EURY|nr:helix-turn-helix domain-containing protein [Halomicrobium zhouii]SFR96680.1 HTH DNA binding domain [Halomicrobium zhouii]
MPAGIRVTVAFETPSACPIADLSAAAGTVIKDVSTTAGPATAEGAFTEFLVAGDAVPDDYDHDPVFAYADRHLYRIPHDTDCPCGCLGEYGVPVSRYFASDGELELVFHAPDFDRLQTIVGEFRDRFPAVDIQRLVRAPTGGTARDTVFVDRAKLTDRQLEVLRTAYEMGYFERPRAANATDVAAEFDVTPSTVTEHLLAAQSKLLQDVLEAGS